jgi:hypothetical protein
MKNTLAAAMLVAGAAFVASAYAQTAAQPQQPGMTTQTQTQTSGTPSQSQTQPNRVTGQTQTRQTPRAPTAGATGGQAAVQPVQGTVPNGSYQTSCKDARMDGQTLIGFCQKPDGTWQTSALRTSQCGGDIQNINGELTCNAGTGSGSSTPPTSPTRATPSAPTTSGRPGS